MKPSSQHIDLPPLAIRADVLPASVDPDARTADVIFSTGAPVQRYDWLGDTRYIETLSLKPKDVRLDRLNSGAPFLNAHNADGLADVLGVVVAGSARVTGGHGVATIRFSKRVEVEPIWQDIRDGILRNVSVGYRVHKYEQTDASEGRPALRHAVDWEPYEISAVPMPADAGAQVRAENKAQTNPCAIIARAAEETPMDPEETATQTADAPTINLADPGAPAGQPPPAVPRTVPPQDSERLAGIEAERGRCEGIIRAVRNAGFPQTLSDRLIREGKSLEQAQTAVLDELGKLERVAGGPQPGPAGTGPRDFTDPASVGDPNASVWRGVSNALLNRAAPEFFKLEDVGRNYRGLTLLECAKVCLQAQRQRVTGLSPMEIAGRALGLDTRGGVGYHTTSDFANILADVANKTLRRAYDEAPQTFTAFSRRMSVSDFKTVRQLQLGEAPALLEVLEHGEYTRGTIAESKEEFALKTYGRVFAITRKALVNDDTDAFSRLTTLFGRSARNKESELVWAQITSNPLMGDGNALFSVAHANLSGTSDAIAVASIGAARAAMRNQRGLENETFLNITPRFLVVPAGKELLADQLVGPIFPTATTGLNPFTNKFTVLAEPRLDANSATAWYLFASPDQIDTVVYAYLSGEEGPVVETRVGFDVDGLEVKCRHDFAAKVIDWRGIYKNPGA